MASVVLHHFAENAKCWQHWTKLCLGGPCYASVAQACFSGGVAQVMPRNKKLGLSAAASSEYCCYFRYVIAFDYCVDILRISQLYTFCIYDIPSLRDYLVIVDEVSD